MVPDEAKEEQSLPNDLKSVEIDVLEERREVAKQSSGRALEEAAEEEELPCSGERRSTRPGKSHCRSSKNHRQVAQVACSAPGSLGCCESDAPEGYRQTDDLPQCYLPKTRFPHGQ